MLFTPKQKQILEYIKKCLKKNGYSPSFEEMARHFKLAKSTIHEHVEALKRKKYLEKTENKSRSIQINKKLKNSDLATIPLLGTIAAGQPIEAIEGKETIKVQQSLLSKSGEHFALRVSRNPQLRPGYFLK